MRAKGEQPKTLRDLRLEMAGLCGRAAHLGVTPEAHAELLRQIAELQTRIKKAVG